MEPKTVRKTQILLLEDDAFHSSLLAEGLKDYYQYEVAPAENLEQAEEWLEKMTPDLLLLDCVLGENRFRVVDWVKVLRKRPALSKIPILFVTAYYREMQDQVKGIDNSDILAKPFTFEDVTLKLRGLLAR